MTIMTVSGQSTKQLAIWLFGHSLEGHSVALITYRFMGSTVLPAEQGVIVNMCVLVVTTMALRRAM